MLFAALAGVAVPVTAEDARTAKAQDLAYQGDIAAAQSLWREIAAVAPENGDIEGLDRARRALAALAFQQGRYDEFAMLQTQRLDDAEARGDIGIQAAARMELAILERRRGRLDTARSGLDEAIGIFRRIGDRDGEGQALTHQGLVLINQGLLHKHWKHWKKPSRCTAPVRTCRSTEPSITWACCITDWAISMWHASTWNVA